MFSRFIVSLKYFVASTALLFCLALAGCRTASVDAPTHLPSESDTLAAKMPASSSVASITGGTAEELFAGVADREGVIRARDLMRKGHYKNAATILRELLKTEEAPGIKFLMGNALYLLGKPDEAAAYYRQVVEKCPGCSDAKKNLGKVLSALGKYREAITPLAEGLRCEGTPEEYMLLARLNLLVGSHFGAEAVLKKIISGLPDNIEAKLLLGQCLICQNRPEQAEIIIKEVLCSVPDSVEALGLYARALAGQKRFSRTADVLEFIRLSSSLDDCQLKMLGDIYVTFDLPGEAVEAYMEASGDKPDPLDLERVGLSFWHLGLLDNAAVVFLKVASEIKSHKANMYLARIYLASGENDKTISYALKARELGANLGEVSLLLGRAYLMKKDYSNAIVHFNNASSFIPTRTEAHSSLGDTYRALGKIEKALNLYVRALQEDPGNKELRRIIKILSEEKPSD